VTAGGLGWTLEIGKGDFGDGWDTVKILHRGLEFAGTDPA